MASFEIGTKAYVITGFTMTGYTKQLWEYDAVNDVWTKKKDFPGSARGFATGFAIGNKGYVVGGSCCGVTIFYNDLWEYVPSTDTWTSKASFPGIARDAAVGFAIGGKGYYGTGRYQYSDFWEYDPLINNWTQLQNVPGNPRSFAVAFVMNNKGYVGYGFDNSGNDAGDLYEFDPTNNSWITKSPSGLLTAQTGCFVIANKAYIGQGYLNGNCSSNVFEYDPFLNSIIPSDSFPGGSRCCTSGFSIAGRGYMGFGVYGYSIVPNDLYEYNPKDMSGTTTSISEINISNLLSVFPNPSSGKFTIESPDPSTRLSVTAIEIRNILGEKIYAAKINSEKIEIDGSSSLTINLSNQRKGIYFAEIFFGQKKETRKIIIE